MDLRQVRNRLMATSALVGVAVLATAGVAAAQVVPTSPAGNGAPTPDAAGAAPLNTQTGPQAGPNAPAVSEVVVTGSRIPQPNLTATSPLTVVNSQELKLEGTTRVEDLLNSLPQVFASQSSGVSNGATGTATVDLRGLGDQRTLVLIDGRRLVPGDPADPVGDLNFIPAALIQRVDVVTGGASSIYGADAVAGVVNFIMQKNFQGVRVDVTGTGYEHDNHDGYLEGVEKSAPFPVSTPTGTFFGGGGVDVTAIVGVNSPDDKGNITAYAGYRSEAAVTQANFDYSACTLAEATKGFACGGSGTSSSARLIPLTGPASTSGSGDYYVDPKTGILRDFNPGTDEFNYGPYNYYQRPDTRYTAGAFAHYEINPQNDVYMQLMFMDDFTNAQIAPSGAFGQTFNIPCNNPLLTAQEAGLLCGAAAGTPTVEQIAITRRNVEGGPRTDELRHDDFRIVLGDRGDLGDGWHYDIYGQYGQSVLSEEYINDASVSRLQEALTGCTSGNTEPIVAGCVPFNIFTPGQVTPAAENYIETPGFQNAVLTEQVVDATLNGNLGQYGVKSPFADDGFALALGTEYRRESLNFQTDAEFSSGDLAGQGGPKIGDSGSYAVYELFGELRIPVVSNKPLMKDLSFDAAYRYSDYTSVGTTNTYSIEGNYSPTSDVRFRAGYNRAVRAPNVNELFTPQAVGLFLNSDPCVGATPVASAAQCANSGVSAAQYGHVIPNSASQYNALAGGNPNLQPEIADTYSAGLVFTPSFFRGFSFTVDYFNIFVNKVIFGAANTGQDILNACVYNDIDCNLVNRAPGTASLWIGTNGYVDATNLNAGSLETDGVDFDANYRYRLPHQFGALSFNFIGTYLNSLTTEVFNGTGIKYNCAGEYGPTCGNPNPRFRAKFRASWEAPHGLLLSAQVRYFEAVKSDGYNAVIGDPLYVGSDNVLGSRTYLDLTATYRLMDRYTFRIGVNNVFDKDPPIVGSGQLSSITGNGNTYPGIYDSLGRTLFAGLTADF